MNGQAVTTAAVVATGLFFGGLGGLTLLWLLWCHRIRRLSRSGGTLRV